MPERALVSRTKTLTWTVIIVVPLVAVIAAAAGPIASLLTPANANAHCVRAEMIAATGTMLAVFAPQALLYGLSVVLYGLLQSHRRFAAPSVGPGISSQVLIACYLAFVPLSKGRPLAGLPITAGLVLSAGTTLGIAVLVLVAVPIPMVFLTLPLPTRARYHRSRLVLSIRCKGPEMAKHVVDRGEYDN